MDRFAQIKVRKQGGKIIVSSMKIKKGEDAIPESRSPADLPSMTDSVEISNTSSPTPWSTADTLRPKPGPNVWLSRGRVEHGKSSTHPYGVRKYPFPIRPCDFFHLIPAKETLKKERERISKYPPTAGNV